MPPRRSDRLSTLEHSNMAESLESEDRSSSSSDYSSWRGVSEPEAKEEEVFAILFFHGSALSCRLFMCHVQLV